MIIDDVYEMITRKRWRVFVFHICFTLLVVFITRADFLVVKSVLCLTIQAVSWCSKNGYLL